MRTHPFYFKRCRKCKGDLYTENDKYGSYIACVQCGTVSQDERDYTAKAAIDQGMSRGDFERMMREWQ